MWKCRFRFKYIWTNFVAQFPKWRRAWKLFEKLISAFRFLRNLLFFFFFYYIATSTPIITIIIIIIIIVTRTNNLHFRSEISTIRVRSEQRRDRSLIDNESSPASLLPSIYPYNLHFINFVQATFIGSIPPPLIRCFRNCTLSRHSIQLLVTFAAIEYTYIYIYIACLVTR